MGVRNLPSAKSLSEAIIVVKEQNRAIGYPPHRFVAKLVNSKNLVLSCIELLTSQSAYTAVVSAITIKGHRDLLTIEDFISVHGSEWGFPTDIVRVANERVQDYDRYARCQRYG